MAILETEGDEIRGERLIIVFRKRSGEYPIHQTSGHRATKEVVKGLPARAIVDKPWHPEA